MSRESSRKISYATLYEEWLLKHGDTKERLKNGREKDEQVHELVSAAISANAGLVGSLQCALMEEAHDIEALTELWDQTLWEIDGGSAAQVESLLSLTNASDDGKLAMHNAADLKDDGSADVDAFFEDYPECVRQDWDDSDSDESDDEVQEIQPPPKKMASSSLQSFPQHQDMDVVAVEQVQASQAESHFSYTEPSQVPIDVPAARMGHPHNPYLQQNSHQMAAMNPPQPSMPMQQEQAGCARYNAWEQSNNNSSWEDFRSQQNPFQTAREFAQICHESEQQQGNDYQALNQQYNAYKKQEPEPQQPIRGPHIPDSLKRKFQPPKRGEQTHRQSQGASKKKGAILSNGGGSLTRPTSSHSDDDELPEALKGLDKELIEKIQNEIMEAGESVSFDDIAGLADAKQIVRELVCWPMKRPDLFTGLRRGPNGLLLFGPPGTGKTLIGKAIAFESKATFFSISSSSLTSKWIGEGEKLVRTLFAVAAHREPAVVFIDEIDSLLTQRKADENEASRRIKTEFLVQLDGTGTSGQGRVLVIGATNRPNELDDAARRRFVKRLYVPLPAREDRQILLETLLKNNRHILSDKCFVKLSKETEGFSGADLKALCTDAAMGPIRQLGPRALEIDPNDVPPISYKHFRQALRGMHPSVAQADLGIYIEWNKTYGNKIMQVYDDEDEDSDKDE